MDLFSKLKKMVMEPKVYALFVRSIRGQVLHIGIHFSLEEAYAAARIRMEQLAPHKPGEAMDIDLWNVMPARECIAQFFDPNKIIPDPKTTPADPPNPMAPYPGMPATTMFSPVPGMIVGQGPIPPEILKLLMSLGPTSIPPAMGSGAPEPVPNAGIQAQDITIKDYVQEMKDIKNEMLQKLVDNGSIEEVDKLGRLLSSHERKFVLKKIAEKAPTPEAKDQPKG